MSQKIVISHHWLPVSGPTCHPPSFTASGLPINLALTLSSSASYLTFWNSPYNRQKSLQNTNKKKQKGRGPLVAQRYTIRLPMRETQLWPLIREDPRCHGATKPVPQLLSLCSRVREPQLLSLRAASTQPERRNLLSLSAASTQPERRNYSARAPQLPSPSTAATQPERRIYSARAPRLLSPSAASTQPERRNYWSPHALELVLHNKRSHRNEKPVHCS